MTVLLISSSANLIESLNLSRFYFHSCFLLTGLAVYVSSSLSLKLYDSDGVKRIQMYVSDLINSSFRFGQYGLAVKRKTW